MVRLRCRTSRVILRRVSQLASIIALLTPDRRLIIGVNVLLVVALAYSLAVLTWRVLPAPEPLPPIPMASPKVVASVKRGPAPGAEIPRWHLFGEVQRQAAAKPKPVELPKTNLKLTLRGLLASPAEEDSWAIVADQSGKENFYKVGATLPGNAELLEIHPAHVVLRRGGREETLELPKESFKLTDGDNAAAARGSSASSRRVSRSFRGPATASRGSSGTTTSLRDYRDALLNDPQSVSDLVSVEPARRGGRFIGYRIGAGRDPGFLTNQGLEAGDIVTSVNGVALTSPAKGLELFRELSSASSLDLVVERDGRRRRLSLSLE